MVARVEAIASRGHHGATAFSHNSDSSHVPAGSASKVVGARHNGIQSTKFHPILGNFVNVNICPSSKGHQAQGTKTMNLSWPEIL